MDVLIVQRPLKAKLISHVMTPVSNLNSFVALKTDLMIYLYQDHLDFNFFFKNLLILLFEFH